jgi:hypothetical protein
VSPARRLRPRPRFREALLALCGAVAIGLGAFAPGLYVDTLFYHAKLRYWDLGGVERYGVLAAAALALPGVYGRRHGLIVLATVGLWIALGWPWIREWVWPDKPPFLSRVAGGITRPVEEMTTQVVLQYDMLQPLWGAYFLVGGVLGLTLAGVLTLTGRRRG